MRSNSKTSLLAVTNVVPHQPPTNQPTNRKPKGGQSESLSRHPFIPFSVRNALLGYQIYTLQFLVSKYYIRVSGTVPSEFLLRWESWPGGFTSGGFFSSGGKQLWLFGCLGFDPKASRSYKLKVPATWWESVLPPTKMTGGGLANYRGSREMLRTFHSVDLTALCWQTRPACWLYKWLPSKAAGDFVSSLSAHVPSKMPNSGDPRNGSEPKSSVNALMWSAKILTSKSSCKYS
jgi:hypothetical protein